MEIGTKIPDSVRSYDFDQVEGRGNAELKQEDFMEIMTAQLQTQDPFAPQGTEAMMEQMTQFSMVESVQAMTSEFSKVAEQMTSSEVLQAVQLLDREVLIDSNKSYLEPEGEISGLLEMDASASGVTISVQNAAGQLVRRIEMGPTAAGTIEFAWDGLDENGKQAVAGNYTINAQAQRADGSNSVQTWLSAKVAGVTPGAQNQPTQLELLGLSSISLDDIKKVR